jgi:hypothetical protein
MTQQQVDEHQRKHFGLGGEPSTSPLEIEGRAKAEAAPVAAEAMPERESDVELPIVADCRERGWLVFWGDKSGKSHRTPGEPDLIILAQYRLTGDPRILLIETKHPKRKRSPVQLQVEAHARKLGHTIHMVKTWAGWLAIADEK